MRPSRRRHLGVGARLPAVLRGVKALFTKMWAVLASRWRCGVRALGWFVVRSRLVSLGPLSHYKPPSPTRGGLLDLLTRSTGRRWLVATGGWSAVFCGFAGGGLGFLVLLGVLCLGLAAVVQWGFRDAGCAPRRRHSRGWCSFAVGVASCLVAGCLRRSVLGASRRRRVRDTLLKISAPEDSAVLGPASGANMASGDGLCTRPTIRRGPVPVCLPLVSFLALTTARGLMRVRSYTAGCGPLHRGDARGRPQSHSRPGSHTCGFGSVGVAHARRVTCATHALTKMGGRVSSGTVALWPSAVPVTRQGRAHAPTTTRHAPIARLRFLSVITSPH